MLTLGKHTGKKRPILEITNIMNGISRNLRLIGKEVRK